MAERLFADEHWTKINTVYASGTGDTDMALIKDDIGNWNLKSFDNDPTELLKAYTEITLKTAKRAAQLAAEISADAGTGGAASSLDIATDFLSQMIQGRTGQKADQLAGLDLTKIKARADQKLVALQANPGSRKEVLNKAREIVQRYAAVIDALQSAVVDSARDTATPTNK